MAEIQYSFPGIPFKELQKLTDEQIFDYMRNGGILHFQESHFTLSSLHFENGEWIYTSDSLRKGKVSYRNLLEWFVRGLSVAYPVSSGADYDVTLEEPKQE